MSNFMNTVSEQVQTPDVILDLILEAIDAMLNNGDYSRCQRLMEQLRPAETALDALILILCTTLPAWRELGEPRRDLVNRTISHLSLTYSKNEVNEIIGGLDPSVSRS